MGLLADMARKEFMKKASEGFDEIDLKIYNEIILPLEENIDLYAEKSDQFIEIQESVLVAYDAYEDIATIITNIRRARKIAQASEKTADTSDKASTIASALDKISAAISYGLKVLKDKLTRSSLFSLAFTKWFNVEGNNKHLPSSILTSQIFWL